MNNYYVYIYRNPLKDNIPFYVGKGKNNRAYDHLNETYDTTSNRRKTYVINSIHSHSLEPIIEFFKTNLSEDEAYTVETELIQKYGRAGYDPGGILTNVCIDSRPPDQTGRPKTNEHRKKLSESHLGKTVTESTRKKLSVITTERIRNGEFGHTQPHTEEAKQKMSNAKLGIPQSEESNKKRSESLKGKPWSESRRLASKKGKKTGPKQGKPWSEARRLAYEIRKDK